MASWVPNLLIYTPVDRQPWRKNGLIDFVICYVSASLLIAITTFELEMEGT